MPFRIPESSTWLCLSGAAFMFRHNGNRIFPVRGHHQPCTQHAGQRKDQYLMYLLRITVCNDVALHRNTQCESGLSVGVEIGSRRHRRRPPHASATPASPVCSHYINTPVPFCSTSLRHVINFTGGSGEIRRGWKKRCSGMNGSKFRNGSSFIY